MAHLTILRTYAERVDPNTLPPTVKLCHSDASVTIFDKYPKAHFHFILIPFIRAPLTPANLRPLFASRPELVSALFPHLPPDLPSPPSVETLERVVSSPQFRAAVRNLDMALRTGLLGGLVRTLGLPEEAGVGIEPFLRALQEQARREEGEGGDRMETD